jgi:catechol 2,3-dioxygenase
MSTTQPLAAHSLAEHALSVPDLDEARRFYEAFGLEVRAEGEGLGLYTFGHPHRWARLLPGERKRLLWLSLGIHAHDLARWERRLADAGVAAVDAPPGADPGGRWLRGPDGVRLQLIVGPKVSPSAPAPREFVPANGGRGRAPSRRQTGPVRPRYLSHVLLFSADVEAAVRFYEDVIGWRLSDQSAGVIAFLHTPHGSDHHLLALARSEGAGFHHSSWCVGSLDEVGLGAQQMAAAGHAQGWGLGRHVLGSNYFRYVRDPWGSFAEYSYDIDFVPAGAAWPAADHPPEDALFVWGPALPEDFVVNHEL